MIAESLNPVVLTLGFFGTLFGGGGTVALIVALINRKSDQKAKDAGTQETLEKVSADFRKEVREENLNLKKDMREMKEAFVPLITVLDSLLPKMVACLNDEEKQLLRASVDKAKIVTN